MVRLNVHDAAAADLLQQLGFRFTPTFILFDESGNEVWRTAGALSVEEVGKKIKDLN